jgi:16S rRNA processing protein RimM
LLERVFLRTGEEYMSCAVRCARVEGGFVYMLFAGVDDRTAAEALRGQLLYVDRDHAVELPEDTEFICDLIGCVAFDTRGERIGTLTDVIQPGAHDVYVFDTARGELLVPALRRVILEVDVASRRMVLDGKALGEVSLYQK